MIKQIKNISGDELRQVIKIWLESNIQAHDFIDKSYWEQNVSVLETELPKAEVYVYEVDNKIIGFIGLIDGYIAGIFVKEAYQNQQIGQQLLTKAMETNHKLSLQVYEKINALFLFIKSMVLRQFKTKQMPEHPKKNWSCCGRKNMIETKRLVLRNFEDRGLLQKQVRLLLIF